MVSTLLRTAPKRIALSEGQLGAEKAVEIKRKVVRRLCRDPVGHLVKRCS